MSLAQIVSGCKEIASWTAYEFVGGRSYLRDRDAYYGLSGKKIWGMSAMAFDSLGAAYTYSHLLFLAKFFSSMDIGNFKYAAIASAVRIAAPVVCKKIADVQLRHPERSWENGIKNVEGESRLQLSEQAIAQGLFGEIRAEGKALYDDGHYLAAMHRLSDFSAEVRKALEKEDK